MTTEYVLATLAAVFAAYRVQILSLVGLVVINLAFGVASALKTKTFDLARLADFYRVDVLPKIIGWIGVTAGVYLVSPSVLGGAADAFSAITGNGLYASAAASLLASIYKSFNEIRS